MLLYRVFPHDPGARSGRPGHPLHVHRGQTAGRWDNAGSYALWYFSTSQAGAAGEAFGNLSLWAESMFLTPFLPSARRALGVFEIDGDTPVLDLDDAGELAARQVRPSQVVVRNPVFTQQLALRVFHETDAGGVRRWAGLSWWSYQRPQWTDVALWQVESDPIPVRLLRVEELDLRHPAIVDAAAALLRQV